MTGRVAVVAIGGNSLIKDARHETVADQYLAAHATCGHILTMIKEGWNVVVTHGNGPQVGLLALEAEAYRDVRPYPLDILGAESQGMIGYLLMQALGNAVAPRRVVTVLTQVRVNPRDPAFAAPSKPIGPVYDCAEAQTLARERGWTVAADGAHYRRVVPSPEPLEIVELSTVKTLLATGAIVVCCGGGGIPVVRTANGLEGVEAVIDKDLTAAVLAEALGAERLVLATDVPAVARVFDIDDRDLIPLATPDELRALSFAPGSMGPKVDAACRFVQRTGGEAVIGALADIGALVEGAAGTVVVPSRAALVHT